MTAHQAMTPKERATAERKLLSLILAGMNPDKAALIAGYVGPMGIDAARAYDAIAKNAQVRLVEIAGDAAKHGHNPALVPRLWRQAMETHAIRFAEWRAAHAVAGHNRTRLDDAPNANRLAQGDIRQGYVKDPADTRGKDERRVYVEGRPTPLHDAYERGQVTPRQLAAGDRIETIAHIALGSGYGRSSIDMSPRGMGNGDGFTQAEASARLHDLGLLMSAPVRDACIGVVVFHQPTGDRRPGRRRWSRVLEGLDIAARFFDLPDD